MRILAWLVVALVVGFLVVSTVGAFVGTRFVWGTIDYVVENLANRSGISIFLVKGLIILLTIPFFWAVAKFVRNVFGLINMGWSSPLGFYRTTPGIIMVVYVGIFFVAMYFASRDAYAYKFCADTPEGITTSDGAGKEPVYGIELKSCSPDQIKELRAASGDLHEPHEIKIADVNSYHWFNSVNSRPLVWYDVLPGGGYRFFDRAGHDPSTGEALHPVSADILRVLRQQQAANDSIRKRKKASEEAQEGQAKADAELRTFVGQAQQQFDSGDYKAAKTTCDEVLKSAPHDESCRTLVQHSRIKLAQQFVKEGQNELEKGQFDEALWSADEAMRLDPGNPNASKLKQFAAQMKPHALN